MASFVVSAAFAIYLIVCMLAETPMRWLTAAGAIFFAASFVVFAGALAAIASHHNTWGRRLWLISNLLMVVYCVFIATAGYCVTALTAVPLTQLAHDYWREITAPFTLALVVTVSLVVSLACQGWRPRHHTS
ncbi:MAG: hypothetical protein Q4B10_07645 [Actinomycetaceae bacterium]|nr:hypothetical protein [Actinomycetaceae bacterium]